MFEDILQTKSSSKVIDNKGANPRIRTLFNRKGKDSPSDLPIYSKYLCIDSLLKLQTPLSFDCPESNHENGFAHDEMLFIITHQTYELWFKQIIFELNSVFSILREESWFSSKMALINQRLSRVCLIQGHIQAAIPVLETMSSADFLEFRDFLAPASGFQSFQFRCIEAMLGLSTVSPGDSCCTPECLPSGLEPIDFHAGTCREGQESLIKLTERWLLRLVLPNFNWAVEFRKAVEEMLQLEKAAVKEVYNVHDSTDNHDSKISEEFRKIEEARKTFDSIFDKEKHDELIKTKQRMWSQQATLNAIFVCLYRHTPLLQMAYQFLQNLATLDFNFTEWRMKHAMLAENMIGSRSGTGGSSGIEYLYKSVQSTRVFPDLRSLPSYLIPVDSLPALPPHIKQLLYSPHTSLTT